MHTRVHVKVMRCLVGCPGCYSQEIIPRSERKGSAHGHHHVVLTLGLLEYVDVDALSVRG